MLEDHVIPFLNKWGVGLWFLGEHGAESIHTRFNSLRRTLAKIPDPTKRLHSIMKKHLLQVSPQMLQTQPEETIEESQKLHLNPFPHSTPP
jgi:hypothetical protein